MKKVLLLVALAIMGITSRSYAQDGLNEIRFENWTDKDWLDNDYIRELRSYIDACHRGDIEDETLLEFKDILQSKFIIGLIEPALFGGVFIHFSFVDEPRKVFFTNVYSYVDEDTREVCGYDVRYIGLDEEEVDFTTEDYYAISKEYPLLKLW